MISTVTTPVTSGVHHVEGQAAGWTILTDGAPRRGAAWTLVDAGYPGYAAAVRGSAEALGLRLADLAAVLVTHGHVDHVGGVAELVGGRDVPVLTGEAEVAHLHGEVTENTGPRDLLPRLHRHGMLPWVVHVSRHGATAHPRLPAAGGAPDGVPLDLPGRPVPLTTPGHTSGHTCWHLPDAGALITGDALVTGHALSRDTGPQVLPGFFHADRAGMLASLDLIGDSGAGTLLPGHGAPWHGPAAEAAEQAARTAQSHL
ncbi:MBL fold metallo-hydrolase [Marmoricola endophyticus]|nr:MBL fold metallo-hydrolase [Marmoricola endophyticus]